MRRLKTTEVAAIREAMRAAQAGHCAICQQKLTADGAVLDHDHATGAIRAALHRGCNALLGTIENNYKRYGVHNLPAFLAGVAQYLQKHEQNRTGLLHPSHKTEDEKRLRRNALARKRRALTKEP